MSKDAHLLGFLPKPVSNDALRAALAATFRSVRSDGEAFVVGSGRGPALIVGLSEAPHVVTEAEDFADLHRKSKLAACRQRVEVLVEDIEAAIVETNTLVNADYVLTETLRAYVVHSWNGRLLLPRGEPCRCRRCR